MINDDLTSEKQNRSGQCSVGAIFYQPSISKADPKIHDEFAI
jgi:hypothetical protein